MKQKVVDAFMEAGASESSAKRAATYLGTFTADFDDLWGEIVMIKRDLNEIEQRLNERKSK